MRNISAASAGNVAVCINDTTKLLYQGGSATSCNTSSRTTKNTIFAAHDLLPTLREIQPVTFYFNDSGDTAQQIGFIAEELAEIDDRLVQFKADGTPGSLKLDNLIGLLAVSLKEVDSSVAQLLIDGIPNASSSYAYLFDGEQETMWKRMVNLATGFVDGILTITGVNVSKVETKELCVDGVCMDSDDLRALLETINNPVEPQTHTTDIPESDTTSTSTESSTNINVTEILDESTPDGTNTTDYNTAIE